MAVQETTAYYAFGAPLYAAVVAAEWGVARRHGRRILSFAPTFGNLSAGLGAIVVGLFLGPALLALYDWGFRTLAVVHWAEGSWVPWVLAVILADLGHYLHHRVDHRVAACWAVHGVHHQPEEMNFTVAMRHAWFSDLYSFPFYTFCPLLGVPASHFFVATTLLSFHALITHSEWLRFPSLGIFVTPASHVLHHAKNPRYIDRNFGAMLCVWDKLFGTHVAVDPADPPVFGVTQGYHTHDGVLAQWVLWRDLLDRARGAAGWERVRVLFGRPAGKAAGTALPEVGWSTRAYVAIQFLAVVVAAHWVLILRDAHGWGVDLLGAGGILAALVTLGGLLDGRRFGWVAEGVRVVGMVGMAGILGLPWA